MSEFGDGNEELDYGPECVLELTSGVSLRCPPFPEECSYVRVVSAAGEEIAYWVCDEWEEAPTEVMGAIFGAALGGKKL
jgi:hypothetical protein